MEGYKSERQRQLDNVQKEILTNYYLQKYNSIMNQITKQPENHPPPLPHREAPARSQRMNFKEMILMKKNENGSNPRPSRIEKQEPLPRSNTELTHKYSSRDELQNQKTMRKLEDSIINELYKQSPSRLEQGSYQRLEINTSKSKESAARRVDLQPIPQENIEITYEDDPGTSEFQAEERSQQQARLSQIKEAIKYQFDRRKDRSLSPQKGAVDSSKISVQVKIHSPKKLEKSATPNKFKQSRGRKDSSMRSSSYRQSSSQDEAERKQRINSFELQRPQIHFSKEIPEPKQQSQQIRQEHEIQFLPPSTDYYKSSNANLVEQSFKYQQEVRDNREQDSEKAQSVASSRKSSRSRQLQHSDSKKSMRSRKRSEFKDSSKMEMSFVSRISMLSSDEGLIIKERIEKELYDNELGPYQSALFNVLQLMEKNPRSGPVYAVGQKALEDRRAFEERRIAQEAEIADLRRKTEKIRRKASQLRSLAPQQQQIRSNQLQILRLIRKLSTTL